MTVRLICLLLSPLAALSEEPWRHTTIISGTRTTDVVVAVTPVSVNAPAEATELQGHVVVVTGIAKHTKGGRPWIVSSNFQVACEGIPSWPAGVLDRQVRVTGWLSRMYVVDEARGVGKTWFVISKCSYELVKP
jgi:hypothetical protein